MSALTDRYRIERELGRGGMATVYLAHDLRHDRPVALKLLHPELAATLGAGTLSSGDPNRRQAAAPSHPAVVRLGRGGRPALVHHAVRWRATSAPDSARETQLPARRRHRIAPGAWARSTTRTAHGIIHRDIKPENILLRASQWWPPRSRVVWALPAGDDRLTQTGK